MIETMSSKQLSRKQLEEKVAELEKQLEFAVRSNALLEHKSKFYREQLTIHSRNKSRLVNIYKMLTSQINATTAGVNRILQGRGEDGLTSQEIHTISSLNITLASSVYTAQLVMTKLEAESILAE